MKHEICPTCGASLDFGEKCECEKSLDKVLHADISDKPNASLDMPKAVSGINSKIEKHASTEELNQSAENIKTDSAEIGKPAPMPRYIRDMINRYQPERR